MEKHNSPFRWVVFISVIFAYLLMSSQRTAPGLITDQLMLDFNVTAATIGILTSLQFFVYAGLQIPMGILADRFGPNFFLVFGAFLTGLGTILYSVSTSEAFLFLARVLTGIGDATVWVNLVLVLGQWFHENEFVRLIGFAGMTGSLGFLLSSVPLAAIISLIGWRTAFFSVGVLLCSCSFLLYYVLVKKPRVIFIGTNVYEEKERRRERVFPLLKRIFLKKQAWALFLCHFGVVGGYVGFISSWAVPYGMSMYSMTREEASELVLIGLFGALIGAPLLSWLSSRLNTIKRPYMIVHMMTLLGWITFLFFKGQPPIFIVVILFFIIGFGFGASALTFALVRKSFPVVESGFGSGIANTGGFLSAVLLPSIFGYILDHFQGITGNLVDGFHYGFFTPVIFSIIGLLGVIAISEKKGEIERMV